MMERMKRWAWNELSDVRAHTHMHANLITYFNYLLYCLWCLLKEILRYVRSIY